MKNKFQSIIIAAIAAVMMASAVSASTYTASPYREEIAHYDDVFMKIYEVALDVEKKVNISEYKLRDYELMQIYSDLISSAPELFYLESKVVYYKNSKYVTDVEFTYRMSEKEIEKASIDYEKELNYIVSLVDQGMSDVEMALWVHDYMISAFGYDEEGLYYDAYSLFTQRKGVCQAYSLGYAAILRELGINCVMISSKEMNHAWNLVEIDGEWYHVDLVFDDPTPDRSGRVLHENFLLSDDLIKRTRDPHYGWSSIIRCQSDKFSDGIWSGVRSRMACLDGRWYYIDENSMTFVSSRFDGETRFDIYYFNEKWYVSEYGENFWIGIFSGVSEYLGHIFINTPYEVLIYTPSTGKSNVFLDPQNDRLADSLPDGLIYGIEIYKGTLEYLMTSSPDSRENSMVGEFIITDFIESGMYGMFPFDDVTRLDSYYSSVKYVYNQGLFAGVSSTKFAPNATLTRAMFVTVLGRLCNVDVTQYDTISFTDVDEGQWYTPYVEWAAEAGIVNGVGDDRFDPLGEITHEQMYKIVAKCGQTYIRGDEPDLGTLILYEDRADISDWAADSVVYCIEHRLIGSGSGEGQYLNPQKDASRAEAADIVANFAKMCAGRI